MDISHLWNHELSIEDNTYPETLGVKVPPLQQHSQFLRARSILIAH